MYTDRITCRDVDARTLPCSLPSHCPMSGSKFPTLLPFNRGLCFQSHSFINFSIFITAPGMLTRALKVALVVAFVLFSVVGQRGMAMMDSLDALLRKSSDDVSLAPPPTAESRQSPTPPRAPPNTPRVDPESVRDHVWPDIPTLPSADVVDLHSTQDDAFAQAMRWNAMDERLYAHLEQVYDEGAQSLPGKQGSEDGDHQREALKLLTRNAWPASLEHVLSTRPRADLTEHDQFKEFADSLVREPRAKLGESLAASKHPTEWADSPWYTFEYNRAQERLFKEERNAYEYAEQDGEMGNNVDAMERGDGAADHFAGEQWNGVGWGGGGGGGGRVGGRRRNMEWGSAGRRGRGGGGDDRVRGRRKN